MREEIMRHWTGLCTVRVSRKETDESTGRTREAEEVIHENLPCHLTYYYYLHHAKKGETSGAYQRGALFVDRDVDIPYGSRVTVVQNGQTAEYSLSGPPVVYSFHREVPVALSERWI